MVKPNDLMLQKIIDDYLYAKGFDTALNCFVITFRMDKTSR